MRSLTSEIVRRISELPGVESAALAENGPLGSRSEESVIETNDGRTIDAAIDMVSPGYFRTIGTALLAGRDFSSVDRPHSKPVVIVNDVLARRLFNNEELFAKSILPPPNPGGINGVKGPLEIVGVVRASRYYDLHLPPPPAIYVDMQQGTAYMPTLHVRLATRANAADVATEVRREFTNIDKNFPVFDVKTLADRMKDSLARERLVGELAGAFGTLAAVLVLVGVHGVVAYAVAQRTKEIGIRMALGAQKKDVLKLVAADGFKLALAGVGIGVVAGLVLMRFLSSLLYGVKATDPLTVVAVSVTLGAIVSLASYIPARWAMKVDPITALRYE